MNVFNSRRSVSFTRVQSLELAFFFALNLSLKYASILADRARYIQLLFRWGLFSPSWRRPYLLRRIRVRSLPRIIVLE
jgi:hypothetical protein